MSNYIQDPNNSKKQIPGPPPDNYYDRVNPISAHSMSKTPNYVYISPGITGNISFFFGTSASFATASNVEDKDEDGGSTNGAGGLTGSGNYQTLIVFSGSNQQVSYPGATLGIHPIAWSGSAADAGKITFVYKSGLATGGF